MNVKQARAAYVQALLDQATNKSNVRDLADMCNEELEYQACAEAMYGAEPHRITTQEAKDIINDMACAVVDDDDLIDTEMEIVERMLRVAIEKALRKSVKIEGTRIVNIHVVRRGRRGQTHVVK